MSDERGTGRTQRMLEKARDLVLEGKSVAVVGAHVHHTHELADRLRGLLPGHPNETERGVVEVLVASRAHLPWNRQYEAVLWDHYAHDEWRRTLERRNGNIQLEIADLEEKLRVARSALASTRAEQDEHARAVVG